MPNRVLVSLCRGYQSLFASNHPGAEELHRLDQGSDREEFCRAYFDYEVGTSKVIIPRLANMFGDVSDRRTLEFGCGIGGVSGALGNVCQSVVGIDLDEEYIAFGNRELARRGVENVTLLAYDGVRIPFDDASFDLVVCKDVIEHVADPEHVIGELERVIRPGGGLYLTFGPPWYHPHGKHCWVRLPGWWTHLLFPVDVAMEVGGYPPGSTWESLGMNRLSVRRFKKLMRQSCFRPRTFRTTPPRMIYPVKWIPYVRELFLTGVVSSWVRGDSAIASKRGRKRQFAGAAVPSAGAGAAAIAPPGTPIPSEHRLPL